MCWVFILVICVCVNIGVGLNCGVILQVLHEDFPANKATELGSYLGLSPARLEEFNHDNPGDSRKMLQDIINYWLETASEKSWTKLAEAIELRGYKIPAKKICTKSSK